MFGSRALFQQTYKAKRPWPPDFSLLSPKHQFRLERRYRRRTALKWKRPRLQKAATLAQWGVISFVVVYSVFWADWGQQTNVFKPIREWVREKREAFWSTSASQGSSSSEARPAERSPK